MVVLARKDVGVAPLRAESGQMEGLLPAFTSLSPEHAIEFQR
jgi:hypothetical protein